MFGMNARVRAVVEWMEGHLLEPQGGGERFRVLPWQREVLAAYLDAGNQTLALSMARGNGKSSFFAALISAHLVSGSPLATYGWQAILIAASMEQARVMLQQTIEMLGDYPVRDRKTGWRASTQVGMMILGFAPEERDVRIRAANPRALHGAIPSLVLLDEPAQYLRSARETIWQIVQSSCGKGRTNNTKVVALGTRASEPTHFFSRLLGGEADFVMDYRADENAPIDKVRTWQQANPSLRAFPQLRRQLEKEVKQAVVCPIAEHAFRSLRLNQGTDVADAERLASVAEWRKAETAEAGKEGRLVLGVDLGEQQSMTAATGYWPDTGRIESWAVFSQQPDLATRARQAKVGDLYRQLEKRQELGKCGAAAPDYRAFIEMVLAKWGTPHVVVCDRYRKSLLADALVQCGVNLPIEFRGLGWGDAGEDIRAFRLALARGDLKPVPSLLLRSGLAVSHLKVDQAGNYKLVKLDRLGRFDAVAAMVLAVGAAERRGWRPSGQVTRIGLFGEPENEAVEKNIWGEIVAA